jgi:hypothetical protein
MKRDRPLDMNKVLSEVEKHQAKQERWVNGEGAWPEGKFVYDREGNKVWASFDDYLNG